MTTNAGYVGVPIITDPAVLRDAILEYMAVNVPGWKPPPGSLIDLFASACARVVAEARDVASNVPIAIFKAFGRTLLGLLPIEAAFASMPSTWTMIDNHGYTIPAGTTVAFQATGNTQQLFRTNTAIVVPPLSTTATGVNLVAASSGEAFNGVPNTTTLRLVDSLAFVTSVVTTAVSSSGADAEDDITYLNRLVTLLGTLAPRPILAADFAALATQVPGVARALAIDNYNPGDGTTNNERMVTVIGVDIDGAALSSPTKTALQTFLVDLRELNFVVNVGDPTFTTVNVNFAVKADATADPATVRTAVIAAVTSWLSPAVFAGGTNNPSTWDANETKIRYLDLAAVIKDVTGVHHVTALTVNGGTVDLNLTGYAPLPHPGTIDGTAT